MSSLELETSVYLMVAKEVVSFNSSLNTTLSYLCVDRNLPGQKEDNLVSSVCKRLPQASCCRSSCCVCNQILGNQWVNSSSFFLFWVTERAGGSVAKACGLWREKAGMGKDLSLDGKTARRSGDSWQSCQKPGAAAHNRQDQRESARRVSLF